MNRKPFRTPAVNRNLRSLGTERGCGRQVSERHNGVDGGRPHAGQCAGFVIAGTSRFAALEGDYRDFFDLVAAQIGTAVTQASAYEEERKRAEALAELDRAKTTFFSNISHEFRTPLTLMLGPLEDLLQGTPPGGRVEDRQTLAVIHRNGRRLLKLVNALLDFSRIQAGRHDARYRSYRHTPVERDVQESAQRNDVVLLQIGRQPVGAEPEWQYRHKQSGHHSGQLLHHEFFSPGGCSQHDDGDLLPGQHTLLS